MSTSHDCPGDRRYQEQHDQEEVNPPRLTPTPLATDLLARLLLQLGRRELAEQTADQVDTPRKPARKAKTSNN